MDQRIKTQPALNFLYLPYFTGYIVEHHLDQYVQIQLSYLRIHEVPLLRFYSHLPENQILDKLRESARIFLEFLSHNQAREAINRTTENWRKNNLKHLDNAPVELDDLFLLSFIRKKTFLDLLKLYTDDLDLALQVIADIDQFFLVKDMETSQIFTQLLKARIEEDSYFREKLTNTSPGFYYLFDIENDRQLQTSDKLFDYLGYDKKQYLGNEKFFSSLFHPDDIKPAEEYVKKLIQAKDKEVLFFEYRLRTREGDYKWMRNYESIYFRNDQGIAIHSIGVAFDVTNEHFVSTELRKREEDLLEAQELANIGSYIFDPENGATVLTPQALTILGLIDGQSLFDFENKIHPTDREPVRSAIYKAIELQGDFDIEYRCTVDNVEKIIWGRGKMITQKDQPILMKGTVMDVTDRHHMLQKLKRSEQLNSQAQAMNRLGNWTWEIQKNRLSWSDELYRIYGMEPQSEILSFEKFIAFVHPDDRESRVKKLQEQLQDTELRDYYFRIIGRDGITKVLYGQSQVLADDKGVPYKMIGTCQDVTKQKELENSFYQKTIQLERSNASLEEFAYITSHDLKEPLRKISVFGDRLLMLDKNELNDESKGMVNKIVESAGRMQSMVDDILSLSRVTSDTTFTKISLHLLLQDVVQSLDHKIEESGTQLTFAELPLAVVNEVQFRQLFQNLITNSIKFHRTGFSPEINISYNYLNKDEVKNFGLAPLKKYLRLLFSDNGIGFENEFGEKIFTIFQRLHGRDQFEGTGIGLAICKKIVEHHHGLIFGRGYPGRGAEFTIIIPEEG